ncbi:MAG: isopentenyl-diphosphate Delta-isomerase [Bacteroidota bacterium]
MSYNFNEVVLVTEQDEEVGTMEKMEAHEKGLLHRAFSIFVFNDQHQLLLHQRAAHKYHSGGLWTNTCCSHPAAGEPLEEATHRRLQEEMGFDCPLQPAFFFTYQAKLDHGLTEHELDHVFIGTYNEAPKLNPEEVMAYKYVSIDELQNDMKEHPEKYTEWFKICFVPAWEFYQKNYM